ncbi:MAG TPA: FHA domain-containing protein [Myxococcales bacterium]|nr:FHA domain-containing protein [Myxococcales bacterium]HIN86704.1 FHA domain-containing protein [Myxococcales bacterium]
MKHFLLILTLFVCLPAMAYGDDQELHLVILTDAHSNAESFNLSERATSLIKSLQDSTAATTTGVCWIGISKPAPVLLPFTKLSELKPNALTEAVGKYTASAESRGLNLVLKDAVDQLSERQGHRTIVIFLAEKHKNDSALDSDVSLQLDEKKITVHAVALGSGSDKSLVRQLVEDSDGVHYGLDAVASAESIDSHLLINLDRARRGRSMLQWVSVENSGDFVSRSGTSGGMGFWGWLFVLSWGVVAMIVLYRFYGMAQHRAHDDVASSDLEDTQSDKVFDPDVYFDGDKRESEAVVGQRFRFVPKDSNFPGFETTADRRDITVGRRKSSDVYLDHPGCSGRHALIRWSNNELRAVDRGSTNGTFVNEKKVGDMAVKHGDIVRFDTIAYSVEEISQREKKEVSSGSEHSQAGTMMLAADDPELKRMIEESQISEQSAEIEEPAKAPSIELHHAHCLRHTNRLASSHCAECNRPYCPDCLEYVLDREVCVRCRKHEGA